MGNLQIRTFMRHFVSCNVCKDPITVIFVLLLTWSAHIVLFYTHTVRSLLFTTCVRVQSLCVTQSEMKSPRGMRDQQ
jgi:hypothetical protein